MIFLEDLLAGMWRLDLSLVRLEAGRPASMETDAEGKLGRMRRTHACAKLLQSCPTLCNPMDCSPLGSSVHGTLQARIPEWVAMPSSRNLPNSGMEPASLTSPALAGGLCLTKRRESLIFDDHRTRIGRAEVCTQNHN